ncbi:MAG: hypothetical protein KatS3mg068_0635 [Candidatus Sericytochromatia bacterium]|nr:MAG: hypothetical protein KatS3mg068_0635 [Candidatus Sericytochromatia bacterium]
MVSVNNVNTQRYGNTVQLTPPSQLYGNIPSRNTYNRDVLGITSTNNLVSDVTQYGIGALSGYKYNQTFVGATKDFGNSLKNGSFKDVLNSAKNNGKVLGGATLNAVGIGALVSGGVSAVSNTISVLNGRESVGDAVSNVTKDSLKGAISGVGGVLGGGLTAMALTMFKIGGTPLTIAAVIGGAVGSAVANELVSKRLGL